MNSGAIKIDLVAPTPTMSFGPFSVDPIRLLTGSSLADILGPLMRGPVTRRGSQDVYQLALPEGEGLSVPIKGFGALGFRNLSGVFIVIVPAVLAGPMGVELADAIKRGDAAGPRFDPASQGQTAEFAIRMKKGMRFGIGVGGMEVGIEAAG